VYVRNVGTYLWSNGLGTGVYRKIEGYYSTFVLTIFSPLSFRKKKKKKAVLWDHSDFSVSVCVCVYDFLFQIWSNSTIFTKTGISIIPLENAPSLNSLRTITRARGSVAGWGTMLQAGRSWVRFLMRSLENKWRSYKPTLGTYAKSQHIYKVWFS
jgi:hypothetical protein